MSARQGWHGLMNGARTAPVKGKRTRQPALEARIAQLEAELQARDDFLAIAAHELRNPMTPISARVELLLAKARQISGAPPEGLVEGLEQLDRLIDAFVRRAATLLQVARISSGNLRLDPAEIDLSALIRRAAATMTLPAESAGCTVQAEVELGINARCDAMAVEQIIENLLSNAIRYGPGQVVEIGFIADGEHARLSVRDHGVGIPQHEQTQIFERFHTLRRRQPKSGLGMGLWITRELVRAMQGEIVVSSRPGLGSTFTVRWPLWPGHEDNAG